MTPLTVQPVLREKLGDEASEALLELLYEFRKGTTPLVVPPVLREKLGDEGAEWLLDALYTMRKEKQRWRRLAGLE